MKEKERKHSDKTAGIEKMSAFDNLNYKEGDMLYFDNNFDSDFDGDVMFNAFNPEVRVQLANPYVIQYQNTSINDVTAYLFGYNDYVDEVNYGNPAVVFISNLQGKKYKHLLKQSKKKNFKISKWRFQSSSAAQLKQTLQIHHVDTDGRQYSSPLNLSIMRDAYQQQFDIIDISKTVKIDKTTIISFTLKANTTLVVTMFPVSKLSKIAQKNSCKRQTCCKYCKFAR